MCVCMCILALVIRKGNRIFSAIYIILSPVWPGRLYLIFPHYFIKGTIFEEKKKLIQQKMCILIFSTIFSETFVILRRMQRDIIINVKRSSRLVPVILVTVTTIVTILIKIERIQQIFQESTNIIFHENPSSEIQVVPCEYTKELTDRHDEINSRFSQFCKRALKNATYDKVNTVIVTNTQIFYLGDLPK